jgi:hypothetical protein
LRGSTYNKDEQMTSLLDKITKLENSNSDLTTQLSDANIEKESFAQ